MIPDPLNPRRQPVKKTLHARLFSKPTKHRAAAAATADQGMEESGINISRSLVIIFAIHIVALIMIFIHKQFLADRTTTPNFIASTTSSDLPAAITRSLPSKLTTLSNGDTPYLVRKGDNFKIIADKLKVDESALRELNRGTDIRSGVVLRVPQNKRIVAEVPPEVTALRDQERPNDSELGLINILPPVQAEAQLIRPAAAQSAEAIPRATPVSTGRTHSVKSGDNLWRISNTYKVNQQELMKLNKISDPTKLKIGQVLQIP